MIPFDPAKLKKGKYSGKNTTTSIKFDLNKKTLQVSAKNIKLTGLRSPVKVQIEIGDCCAEGVAYDGEAQASGGPVDMINGAKPVPIQFLAGCVDSLRVDKYKFKLGTKKPSTDSLTIQGAITVKEDTANIADEDVIVQWGSFSVTIPAVNISQIGSKKAFKYKKPKGSDNSVAAAIFDLDKCTFKIIIKKADIGYQDNPVEFGLSFGTFDETVEVVLP